MWNITLFSVYHRVLTRRQMAQYVHLGAIDTGVLGLLLAVCGQEMTDLYIYGLQ